MKLLSQVMAVLRKELLIEWRQSSRISGVFFFALAIVLLVGFASPSEAALREQAGGTLWIAILLASTRSLDQSYAVDLEHGALEGMVLWPVSPTAIYYGKAIANAILLGIVAFSITPLVLAIYNAELLGSPWKLIGFLTLGCMAIAAPGTLYALITAQARGASVLLPLMLFPLVVPALLAAAHGCTVVLQGDPMLQASSWLGLLSAFNVLHWSLSGLLYARIVEDS